LGRSQRPLALLQGLREPKCDLATQWPKGRPSRVFKLATQDRIKPDGGRDHHVGGVGAHDEKSSDAFGIKKMRVSVGENKGGCNFPTRARTQ
jgi:hypothetical protein